MDLSLATAAFKEMQTLFQEFAPHPLSKKIVSHRGWHRINHSDKTKPMENTRNAYLEAAALLIPYAECDVWMTKDGHLVLSHNKCMSNVAADPLSLYVIR